MNKPTIPEALPLMYAYRDKPENSCGGSLHVVLDEGNIRDDDIKYCIEYARESGDTDGVALGEILLKMSKTQRGKLAGMFYNCDFNKPDCTNLRGDGSSKSISTQP